MTWAHLAEAIMRMPPRKRQEGVVFVMDYHGPDRQKIAVELVRAYEDVFVGISVGNECVLDEGDYFLADVDENVWAGPP